MATDNVTCVSCGGAGKVTGIMPVYGPDHKGERKPVIDIECHRCDGSGLMPAIHLEWIKLGRAMKIKRLERAVTLRAEAQRRGMLPSELSAMEQGRVKPVPAEKGGE